MALYQRNHRYIQPRRQHVPMSGEAHDRVDTTIGAMTKPDIFPHLTEFAKSLIQQYRDKRWLSPNQIDHLERQASLAFRKANEADRPAQPQGVTADSVAQIVELFEHAARHLKFPAIVLQTPDGEELRIYRAGNRSKVPGAINITAQRGEVWYGRILANGQWVNRGNVPESVSRLVFRFAMDPVTVAAEYGRLTGRCCFCRQHLQDERSTAEGYGPICAEHYGLPWGNQRRNIA